MLTAIAFSKASLTTLNEAMVNIYFWPPNSRKALHVFIIFGASYNVHICFKKEAKEN
jgi:hypothetical protein